MRRYDAAIFGAGPVGLTLALLLARASRARLVMLDRRDAGAGHADPRAIALSRGSLQILARVIDVERLPRGDIRRIEVSQRGRLGRTVLRDDAPDALGAVVRYADLVGALEHALATVHADRLEVVRPAQAQALAQDAEGLAWTDPRGPARATLGAHAEGGMFDEAPRANAGMRTRRDYAQTAIVAEIESTTPRPGVAFERFGIGGPLAVLPMPEHGRYAVVWCMPPDDAGAVAALDDDAFAARLEAAFGPGLGTLRPRTPRHAFALGLARREDDGPERLVRIGNAAQTLHPVAGQGLNLGLRDAFECAQAMRAVADARDPPERALARFRAARRADRTSAVRATDVLARGFASQRALAHHAAGAVLASLDLVPPARDLLARRMMFGVRD